MQGTSLGLAPATKEHYRLKMWSPKLGLCRAGRCVVESKFGARHRAATVIVTQAGDLLPRMPLPPGDLHPRLVAGVLVGELVAGRAGCRLRWRCPATMQQGRWRRRTSVS